MPETTFLIPALRSQADADAVMFELQDLPCVHQADVDLETQTAWVSHSSMISASDISDLANLGVTFSMQPLFDALWGALFPGRQIAALGPWCPSALQTT